MAESSCGSVQNNEGTPKSSRSGENSDPQDKAKTENVLRPILLEDYKYEESPESLQNLMKYFENTAASPSRTDILVGLIYILMLECGFVPSNYLGSDSSIDFNYQRVVTLSHYVPFCIQNNKKTYYLKLLLPNFPLYEVKLTVVCVSDDVIVNCFVKGVECGNFTVPLDPLTYFTSSNTNIARLKFQHLDHLSRKIKNDIAFPAKSSILKQNGIAFPCLEDLPTEILLLIMRKLTPRDLTQLGKINNNFFALMRDLLKKLGKKRQ